MLIPLVIYFIKRPKEHYIKPVFLYLIVALILNIICDVIRDTYYSAPKFIVAINYNLPFYNIHSILRLFLFVSFFHEIKIPLKKNLRKIIPFIILIAILLNFTFFDSFTSFSSKLFTIESILLIIYCISYFFILLRKDDVNSKFDSSLIIATGLAVYEAVCFPIFLFYDTLVKKFEDYAIDVWDVHNIMYIILCLFIARAFYGRNKF